MEVTRVRLSVDVKPELRRQVRIAAASKDQSVKEWLEEVLERELGRTPEDVVWMESDLSHPGEYEPYEWAEGELDDGIPVNHEPRLRLRIEGSKRGA